MAGVAGRSGRRPKTSQAHQANGTWHGGPETPDPPVGEPQPPTPLSGAAAAAWRRLIALLTAQGTLTIVDGESIYQYCRLFAETEAIAATERNVTAAIVRLQAHSARLQGPDLVACLQEFGTLGLLHVRTLNQLRQGRLALRTYLVEFGLTPASRSRVTVARPPTMPPSKWQGLVS